MIQHKKNLIYYISNGITTILMFTITLQLIVAFFGQTIGIIVAPWLALYLLPLPITE